MNYPIFFDTKNSLKLYNLNTGKTYLNLEYETQHHNWDDYKFWYAYFI